MKFANFIITRITVAAVCLCIFLSYAYALNLFKRSEWLVYALDQAALIVGLTGLCHILAIILYKLIKAQIYKVDLALNILTLLSAIYFLIGFIRFTST